MSDIDKNKPVSLEELILSTLAMADAVTFSASPQEEL